MKKINEKREYLLTTGIHSLYYGPWDSSIKDLGKRVKKFILIYIHGHEKFGCYIYIYIIWFFVGSSGLLKLSQY